MKIQSYSVGCKMFATFEEAVNFANATTWGNGENGYQHYVDAATVCGFADFGDFESGFQIGISSAGKFTEDFGGPYSLIS